MRDLGIKVLNSAPWGTHLCQFYKTKKDLIDVLVPYFKAGLQGNEFCIWVTAEPLSAQEAKKALSRRVKDLDHYIKKGQIEIIDYKDWYTKSGKFDSDKVLQGWARKEKQAIKKGFDGLRVTGSTLWLEKSDWKKFKEYEDTLNDIMEQHRMIVICSYSLDKCGAMEIIDLISNHQSAFIRRNGKWQIFSSSYYKREGERLKRTDDKYKVLFEGSASGVLVADLGTKKFGYANPAICRTLGYTAEELTQLGVQDVHRKEDLQHVISEFEAQACGEKTLASDIPCMRKDGSIVYTDINTTRVFFEGRDCNVGFFTDVTQRRKMEEDLARHRNNLEELVAERTDELKEEITERKRAEKYLREKEEILRATIESTVDGILVVNEEGSVVQANERFAQLWRIPRKILETNDDEKLLAFALDQLEDPGAFLSKVNDLYSSTEEDLDTLIFKDGRVFERYSRPLIRDGKNRGRVWSFRDITERKKIERMKDEFISTVSHELRTPLTSIHGALGLITSGKTGEVLPETKKLLDIAVRNSARLRSLIDDILDIQKIESGKEEFDFRPLDLKSILKTTLEENKSFGDQFNVEFVLDDIMPEVKVNADSNRLAQVMNNLLSNAAKFSPPNSSVEVSVSRHDKMVRVSVKDHGSGIPVEFQDKLFKKFTQADSSNKRARGGTGLGLSIVKSIIDRHDGNVDFKTELEMGTTFYFELPEWKGKKDEKESK